MEMDKTAAGVATNQRFVVDSLTNVASLTDISGLPASVLTGRSIDSHYGSIDSAGNVAFGIGDALGSTVGLTNAAGTVASKMDYEPYGQTTGAGAASYPFVFTGRISVAGSVIYFRNRYYDSSAGRFLSEDPIGYAGGDADLYRYVGDSPVSTGDPNGTWAFLEPLLEPIGVWLGRLGVGLGIGQGLQWACQLASRNLRANATFDLTITINA